MARVGLRLLRQNLAPRCCCPSRNEAGDPSGHPRHSARNDLDVTQPPSLAALLERCEPSAQRIKREYDPEPDRVDADETKAIIRGLLMRQDANKPRHIVRG